MCAAGLTFLVPSAGGARLQMQPTKAAAPGTTAHEQELHSAIDSSTTDRGAQRTAFASLQEVPLLPCQLQSSPQHHLSNLSHEQNPVQA